MPIKTSSGKWKWGNVERSSKKELVQTVYGIWKKNGSKGSFSDFLKGTHESVLNEAKTDLKDKLYFHGSAFKSLYEDKTIKPPSYSRPFFITSDIYYAIAFSGHRYGGSGRVKGRGKFIDVKKERYVYVVSLNKNAEFLDFRTNKGYNEFISFFPDGLKEILKTLPQNLQHFNVGGDPFKIGVAIQELLENLYDLKIERKVANPATDEVWEHAWIRLDKNTIIDKLYKELFETKNILSELIKQSNSLQKIRNIGPHDLLAYVYKELDKKGYSGIIGIEEDTNEQRKSRVKTENSIGIWNVNGLDRLTTTALPVSKLDDINKYIDMDIHKGDAEKEINQRIVNLVNAIEKKSNIKESAEENYFVTDLDYNKHIKPVLDIFKTWPHVNVENITKHDKDVKLKWFGLYTGHKLEDIVALVAIQTNFDDYTINIANICSNGHGNGKKLLDKIIDYYSKTDRKYLVWFADPNGGEKLKNYYRTNFPDAKETEEKNEWWQTSKFTLKLKESIITEDAKIYAYHCTNVNPEIIKKEGWKVGNGFTLDNQFKDLYKKYLPNIPVFISRLDVPVWDSKSKYCIKLDITGLELFPDFGHLPDFGAYYDYDEEYFYWENENDLDNNKKLKDFVLNNCDNLTLYADSFNGDDSFNVLGTACVDGSKLKNRIVEWKSNVEESYEPPYTLDVIKQKYGDEVYRKLKDDPVHRFRADTGIEVIHKEPTRDEFERIVKNWDLMDDEMKKQSDEFSVKQFGRDNKDRIELLRKEYDFKVGDRVTVRKGLRCRQSGHSGEIIRVNLPEDHDYDSHGFSSFTIKMDDPNLGITSFQSGAIEKEMKKESVISEDKSFNVRLVGDFFAEEK